MKKLTQEQKENLYHGVENEGFDYYFLDYANAEEEYAGTEIEPLITAYVTAAKALRALIDSFEQDIAT